MFAPWCPTCRQRMLLGPRRVEAVEQSPTGPRVVLRCYCDTPIVWSASSDGDRPTTPVGLPAPAPRSLVLQG